MTTTNRADSQLRACVAASDVRFAVASQASSGALTPVISPVRARRRLPSVLRVGRSSQRSGRKYGRSLR